MGKTSRNLSRASFKLCIRFRSRSFAFIRRFFFSFATKVGDLGRLRVIRVLLAPEDEDEDELELHFLPFDRLLVLLLVSFKLLLLLPFSPQKVEALIALDESNDATEPPASDSRSWSSSPSIIIDESEGEVVDICRWPLKVWGELWASMSELLSKWWWEWSGNNCETPEPEADDDADELNTGEQEDPSECRSSSKFELLFVSSFTELEWWWWWWLLILRLHSSSNVGFSSFISSRSNSMSTDPTNW